MRVVFLLAHFARHATCDFDEIRASPSDIFLEIILKFQKRLSSAVSHEFS